MKNKFTLIELMAVILIIGILMGLVSALIPQMRERSRRTQCANNLKTLGLAIESYAQDNNLQYPFGVNTALFAEGFVNFAAGSALRVYLGAADNEDAYKRFGSCPSREDGGTSGNHSYAVCMDKNISPNSIDEVFVMIMDTGGGSGAMRKAGGGTSSFDNVWNHIKPNYFKNVLFGDGSVRGYAGEKNGMAEPPPKLGIN